MSEIRTNPAFVGMLAGLALLASASSSSGQTVSVQTVGGGVRTACGPTAGFVGGNTWQAAQFNQPVASVLDSAGDLWIADLNNSDVEEVTLAGNRTSSLTFDYASGANKHPFPNVIGVAIDSSDNLYVLTTTQLYEFANVTLSFPNLNTLFQVSLSAYTSATATAISVVNDASTNIYISFTNASGGTIIRIPQVGNPLHNQFTTLVNNFAFAPSGMSMRTDGQLAVCDTRNNGIYLVGTNASSTPTLVTGGNGVGLNNGSAAFAKFDQPRGISASADGRMVVCDTMNNALRLIDTSFNTTTLYGTASNVWAATQCNVGVYAGWVDGNSGTTVSNASGRQPVSVTIAPSGTLFVTETFYNLIRAVTGSGLTPVTVFSGGGGGGGGGSAAITTLPASGITTSGAILNASVTPTAATTVFFEYGTNTSYGANTASTNLSNLGVSNHVSFAVTGFPVNTLVHYQAEAIVSGVTSLGGDLTFITGSSSSGTLSISPSFGYFPECETIMVTSSVPAIYYTEDGTAPTQASSQVLITQTNGSLYVGSFQWCNSSNDLSALQIATLSGGVLSTATVSAAPPSNQVGFVRSPLVGIGSVAYVPIVMDLQSGVTVKSLDFRIEVTPTTTNTPPISSMDMLPITTNDFVQFVGPAPGNTPVSFDTFSYTTSSNGQGLLISALGSGTGLDIQNFGVIGLLEIPIPFTATTNESYTLSVFNPSATSDGLQANVPLSAMSVQLLTVEDLPYLAGDSSPSFGYNSEEFGDGLLKNSDINNALYASMGVRVPPPFSDAFNAMDVYPQTPSENGDGLIQFQDWNQILLRSSGLQTNNWIRFWTNGGFLAGVQTSNGVSIPAVPTDAAAPTNNGPPPGQVWFCPAVVAGATVTNQAPGSTCTLPISANVRPGYSLAGFQFRAIVSPNGNAPQIGAVQFHTNAGILTPYTFPGLSPNDILTAWPLGGLKKPLTNNNSVGYLSFQIPANAQPGQSYSIHFLGVDGAGDTNSDYAMESFPGTVWVQSTALQAPSLTSDEWKMHFFGALDSPLAADGVDADGDGMSNWQEYLAGTDPTLASSVLHFSSSGLSTNGVPGVAMSWLTAPNKTYVLQSTPAWGGNSWTSINTNSGDGYNYQFIQTKYNGTAQFYRILLQP